MGAVYKLGGESSGAVKAVGDLDKALGKVDASAQKSAKATKMLEENAKRVAAAADPQEKYNQKMAKLAELVKHGGLSLEHARTQAAKYGMELDKASVAGDKGFGATFVGKIGASSAAIGGATAAVAVLTQALMTVETAAQGAADAVVASLGSVGELQQLGPEGFMRGLGISRELVRSGAVAPTNQSQAVDIATDLLNAGFNDKELNFLVRDIAASKLVKSENLVNVGGNLRKLQRLFDEGSLERVTASSLNAANQTQASLAQTTREVVKFAPGAAKAGFSLDETLAAFEVNEQNAASPEAAAEYLKSLTSQINRRQLAKEDLQGTLANIRAAIPKGGTAYDVLGDANAVTGFDILQKNMRLVTRREDEIAQARWKNANVISLDPISAAADAATREGGGYAAAMVDLETERENLFDAVRNASRRRAVERGDSALRRYVYEAAYTAGDVFGDENYAIRGAAEKAREDPNFFADPDTLKRIENYLERIANGTEATNRIRHSRAVTRPE